MFTTKCIVDILENCDNELLKTEFEDAFAQLDEPLPIDWMSLNEDYQGSLILDQKFDVKHDGFSNFQADEKPTFKQSVAPTNNCNSNAVLQNVQINNVQMPLPNTRTMIISSANLQPASQPLIYTSIPIQNQPIIIQDNKQIKQNVGQKAGPVILQNVQHIPTETLVLQAKLLRTENKVHSGLFILL